MTVETAGSIFRSRLPYLVLTAGVLVIDQWSKLLVRMNLDLSEARPVVEGFFDLVYFQNTGIAFGLLDGGNSLARVTLLSGFAIAAAVIVVVYSVRNPPGDRALQSALALILGGALGNLCDRVRVGFVTDFLYLHLGSFDWPAFNVADTAISVGVGLMSIEFIRHELRDRS